MYALILFVVAGTTSSGSITAATGFKSAQTCAVAADKVKEALNSYYFKAVCVKQD